MHDRRILPVFEGPLRNLILPRKPNVVVALRIREESIKYTNAIRMTIDPVVHAYEHHPSAVCALFVQLVELVLKCLFICKRVVALQWERGDVIHAEGIGNGHEVLALYWNDEGFIGLGSSMV
jgi:hypothetical protein